MTAPEPFRNQLGWDIFKNKYSHNGSLSWDELAATLVYDVDYHNKLTREERDQLIQYIREMKFIPGGRYLYYAGRPTKFFNNCYLLRAEEDTRQDWANLSWKSESCLMTGGGIGIDYSVYRPEGSHLGRTGGTASGPIPKMEMINEIGRRVMQGGSRRSAIYGSLSVDHPDAVKLLDIKNWHNIKVPGTDVTLRDVKNIDFNWPCPLDMTNISINYNTKWLEHYENTGEYGDVFLRNVSQAITTGEPGFSFNFHKHENETLRNACTEVTSEDDSDVCNLGSVNLSRLDSFIEFCDVVRLATKFLLLGTLRADLPYEKIHTVRKKNRRLGLGLMGVHEWLLKKGHRYEVSNELHNWLFAWKETSDNTSRSFADSLGISRPVANRAVAPTGTIGMLAGTTTGIEPLFAVAYKRRYLKNGTAWHYQYYVDFIAQQMIDQYGLNPEEIESSYSLSEDYERRIKFQADVQDYTDMSISSTINLPERGEQHFSAEDFASTLAKYASRLRGFTAYPSGSRGGQPLTTVPYYEAKLRLGEEFEESKEYNDICSITGGGVCGS